MLHFLVFFVCSSLPLDSDIFTDFCFLLFMRVVFSHLTSFHHLFIALERTMKGVADTSHWNLSWGTKENSDLRAFWSLLLHVGGSVKLDWLVLGSRRLPAQFSGGWEIPGIVFTFLHVQLCSSEIRGFHVVHCSPRWYCQESLFSLGVHGVLCSPGCPWALWHLACFPGGTSCATAGNCLWRTWKFPSQKCNNRPREQPTDTATGELWTWFWVKECYIFSWGFHPCNPGRDFGDWSLFRCSCCAQVGSLRNRWENTGRLHGECCWVAAPGIGLGVTQKLDGNTPVDCVLCLV